MKPKAPRGADCFLNGQFIKIKDDRVWRHSQSHGWVSSTLSVQEVLRECQRENVKQLNREEECIK